jgi:hypothetical protein
MSHSRVLRGFAAVAVIALIVVAGLPAHAQENNEPLPYLIQMLSMVPASAGYVTKPDVLEIQYADMRANEQARPGVPTPASLAALAEMERESRDLWLSNSSRLIGISPELRNVGGFAADMVDYLGLDYFDIDRSLYFGPPPHHGVIYSGHFNADQIIETLTRRTYTLSELNGIPVLCGPIGCENGHMTMAWLPDQGERDPATLRRTGVFAIFGGQLGRQQPIALPPGYTLSATDWRTMHQMTSGAVGAGLSLYDVPDYRAIADFAVAGSGPAGEGLLIQVLFFSPSFFDPEVYMAQLSHAAGEGATADDYRALFEKLGVDENGKPLEGEDLPLYPLGAIVDRQEGVYQVHSIVLVYPTQGAAQRAAAEVVRRIPLQSALPQGGRDEPLIDLVAPEVVLDPPLVVHHPEVDRWLAVATVRNPMPSNEATPESLNHPVASGRLLTLWYRTMMTATFWPVQLTPSGD